MRALLLVLSLIPAMGFSQVVKDVVLDKSVDGQIIGVLLKGTGFGAKAVPIFYDQVGTAYEKGVPNDFFNSFTSVRQITQKDTMWNASSPWGNVTGPLIIGSSPEFIRGMNTGKYYEGTGIKVNLQNPRVHSRSGTPQESKKLYISWWFRQLNETRNYFRHTLGTVDDGFVAQEGDEFVVDVGMDWTGIDKVYGRVVAYFPETKLLHANYYAQNNANRINGKRLTLTKTGKGALLETYVSAPGSNKYIRVWESDGMPGSFRSSWTNTEVYQADFRRVQRSNVVPQVWNHLEYFADQEKKYVKTKVNGVVDAEGYYTQDSDVPGHSPTIGLIGIDGNQPEMIQKIWMDDIYLDGSFKRVVLGNAAKHSDVTHEEVQFYTKWIDSEIKFTPYYGGLDRKKPAYIYIYSEDDVPNAEGIPFESPPKMEQ